MNLTIILGTISIIILTGIVIVYKKSLPEKLDKEINLKKQELQNIENEINFKMRILRDINNNDIDTINQKLDDIYYSRQSYSKEKDSSLYILIIIIGAAILYFLHKWTYYIQPENIHEIYDKMINNIYQGFY